MIIIQLKGFDPRVAGQWVEVGFKLDELRRFEQWQNKDFEPQQATEWIKLDLETKDYEFATYLRWKGHINRN